MAVGVAANVGVVRVRDREHLVELLTRGRPGSFGPAADGGFWLVGARRRPHLPALFARVRWSSPHALADTLAGLPRGARVGFAATLEDIDDGDAYRRFLTGGSGARFPPVG